MIFGEVEAFVLLVTRLKKFFIHQKAGPGSVASRFIQLFESHGVHRNQIPRFFDHGLHVSDLKDDNTLLSVLDEKLLDAAADLFAVQREWLDGADDQIYPLHDFYKQPEEFIEFIGSLKNDKTNLDGVLLVAKSSTHEEDALLILEEGIGFVGDRAIYRYHLCDGWVFKYWKARAYLTACIASAWKRKVYIKGREVPIDLIQRYVEGTKFLEYSNGDALPTRGKHWHPEDMSLHPEKFLDGVDEGEFGRSAALGLWLTLDEKGLMDADLPYSNVRSLFEKALDDMKAA